VGAERFTKKVSFASKTASRQPTIVTCWEVSVAVKVRVPDFVS
jgi:hypothetical protein